MVESRLAITFMQVIFCYLAETYQNHFQIHESNWGLKLVCMDCFYTCFIAFCYFTLLPSAIVRMIFLKPMHYFFNLWTLPTRNVQNFYSVSFYYFYLFLLWNFVRVDSCRQLELCILLQHFQTCCFCYFLSCFLEMFLQMVGNQVCHSLQLDFDYLLLCYKFDALF